MLATAPVSGLSLGARVLVSVRPEQLRVHNQRSDGAFAVTITVVLPLGPHVIYEAQTHDGISLKISQPRDAGTGLLAPGDRVFVAPATPAACQVFVIS